jgi:hypothetical protein
MILNIPSDAGPAKTAVKKSKKTPVKPKSKRKQ